MEKIIVEGGKKLQGTVSMSGAKNSILALLPATLLAEEECTLNNIPRLRDVSTMMGVLSALGLKIEIDGARVRTEPPTSSAHEAPYDMVKTMRASILVLGPLLAKFGKARVSLPGGCAIGLRPIDLHLKGLQELGAKIEIRHGYIEAEARQLRGAKIYLDRLSVGATENLMMAAVRAKGETVIENADKSPEIEDLANFLNKMGARISGAGNDTIEIEGVKSLKGCEYTVIPDRIETGTFMIAAAITGGDVKIEKVIPEHLESLIKKLQEAGVEILEESGSLRIRTPRKVKAVNINTLPYPGFPTDMQPQMTSLMTLAEGTSIITETVFENRFMQIGELQRMGAEIQIEGRSAVIEGVPFLSGAPVMASDLRAGASLILAGLAAQNKTEVSRVYHIDRGYENMEKKLASLGARIRRVKE